MRNLKGKRALITGGAAGIGKAIAEHLAPEGVELVLVDLNQAALDKTAEELRAKGPRVSRTRPRRASSR